jgi:hypothetical protein
MLFQVFKSERYTGSWHDKSHDLLAFHRMGHTDHCGLLHAFTLIQDTLDLAGTGSPTGDLDDIIGAPAMEPETLLILHRHITVPPQI